MTVFHSPHLLPHYPSPRIKVGLLGGSFNPAHQGHIHISKEAKKRLKLDQVWWLVSPQNPLKSTKDMASLEIRVKMAQKLTKHQPFIKVTDIEHYFPDNYTYHTIKQLQALYPNIYFIWLMGADNLAGFHQWYRWRDIFNLLPIAVFARGTAHNLYPLSSKTGSIMKKHILKVEKLSLFLPPKLPAWTFFPIKKLHLSATSLRKNMEI